MRVTQSMFYDSIYSNNNQKLTKSLFDVNRQIASGLKIQYASEDVTAFTETMRLDNEITILGQIKQSTESGYKVANQTDTTLNEFESTMTRMRTLLVQAANGTNGNTSLDAIAKELRGIESNLFSLANTSINGQYLFSGSAVGTRPIDEHGIYQGNTVSMNSFLGSNNRQQYNLPGSDLFLGEEGKISRKVSTNVVNDNLIKKHSVLQNAGEPQDSINLSASSTIRNLMGDLDNTIDPAIPRNEKHHFYLRGTTSGGTAFKEKISFTDTDKVSDLLGKIGTAYGNIGNIDVVDVTMNDVGQIVVSDKLRGSSKLDFHLVGAVDFDNGGADDADVTDIDALDSGERDFDKILANTSTAVNTKLHIKEFSVSGLIGANSAASKLEGLVYDRTLFEKNGSKISSSVAQVVKPSHIVDVNGYPTETISASERNSFATSSTLLFDVADLSQGTAGTLDGTVMKLNGFDINGNAYDIDINLNTAGSTFVTPPTVPLPEHFIYNVDGTKAEADKITYRQLMDVMNMVTTNTFPSTAGTHNNPDGSPMNAAEEYHYAVGRSTFLGNTDLSYDGKIGFHDLNNPSTKATISLYDSSSDSFAAGAASSVMTFNTNNAVTVRDPKTDFFKTLNSIITAVEDNKLNPDSSSGDLRNAGIANAIEMMDDLLDHISRSHATVGAFSNTLTKSLERTSTLDISTQSLRSSVIDTDLAQAALTLTQLTTNFEALLRTVGRVSQLSLVNYL